MEMFHPPSNQTDKHQLSEDELSEDPAAPTESPFLIREAERESTGQILVDLSFLFSFCFNCDVILRKIPPNKTGNQKFTQYQSESNTTRASVSAADSTVILPIARKFVEGDGAGFGTGQKGSRPNWGQPESGLAHPVVLVQASTADVELPPLSSASLRPPSPLLELVTAI
ncbi:hypothetical protein NL676_034415 [Syzygium grande]|nr:hypothetical protein NL676_034415 [Syzygium grande]